MKKLTTAGKAGSMLILMFAVLLALLLTAGCGGGSLTAPPAGSDTETPGVGGPGTGTEVPTGETPGEGGSPAVKFGTMLPLGTPLPDVPADDVKAPAKAASTVLDYPGADYMLAAGGTVDGDELVLQSSADSMAWAMYRADGLADLDIEIYSIEAQPGDLGQNYEVGFSEFISDDWLFLIDSTLPEAEVNLAEAEGQFISALGNLYFLVTVDGGDSVRISASHLLTADAGNEPPGGDPTGETFIGQLLELGDGSFSLSSDDGLSALAFSYDAQTQWFDSFGQQITPDQLLVGDLLLVEASGTPAGGWYAMGVMLLERGGGGGNPGDPGGIVFLEGEILSIGEGLIVLADQTQVAYDENTQWFNENGPAAPGDFAAGDYVLIDAESSDAGLLALTVFGMRKTDPGDPGDPGTPLTFVGEITELGLATLTLDQGVVFQFDESTIWLTENGEGGPADFAVGDLVQVDAVENPAGLLAVFVMKLERGGGDIIFFCGEIAELVDAQIALVDGTVVAYDANTLWFDELLNPSGPEAFGAGDQVGIEATASDNGWLALSVYKFPDDPNGGDPGTR